MDTDGIWSQIKENSMGLLTMVSIIIIGFVLMMIGSIGGAGGVVFGIGALLFFIASIPYFHYTKKAARQWIIFIWVVYIIVIYAFLSFLVYFGAENATYLDISSLIYQKAF